MKLPATSQELQARAISMREVSRGFSDAGSRTLIEMAEGVAAAAAALEAAEKPE